MAVGCMAVGCMAVALRPRCCHGSRLHGSAVALRPRCCHGSRLHGSRIAAWVLAVARRPSVLPWQSAAWRSHREIGAAMAVGRMAVQLHCGLGAAMAVGCMAVQSHCGLSAAMAVGCMTVALRPRCCYGSRLHDSRIAASVLAVAPRPRCFYGSRLHDSRTAASVLPVGARLLPWQSHCALGAAMRPRTAPPDGSDRTDFKPSWSVRFDAN